MRTAFHFAMAIGLTVEGFFALRRRRVLTSWQLVFVLGMGGFGIVLVLARSFADDAGLVRMVSGVLVLVAFLACLAIDVVNRQAVADRTRS